VTDTVGPYVRGDRGVYRRFSATDLGHSRRVLTILLIVLILLLLFGGGGGYYYRGRSRRRGL
jgi:hypothetical protein